MPFSGKIPSRQAIDKAVAIHGVRIKSTPGEFATAIFETARRIEELERGQGKAEKKGDRPAPGGGGTRE